jgi:predicted pyridoxine 5'-phosphate oxidase superfamily flavin-nucleotide-binding protein
MSLITQEIKEFLEQQKLGFVATVSVDGTPNISPKGTIIGWNSEFLAFANIRSPDTVNNLKNNSNIEINVIDPLLRRGYLFKGVARILNDGQIYDEILEFYKNMGIKSTIHEIILVNISDVTAVTSPLYDMGISEQEIKSKWKKYFNDL